MFCGGGATEALEGESVKSSQKVGEYVAAGSGSPILGHMRITCLAWCFSLSPFGVGPENLHFSQLAPGSPLGEPLDGTKPEFLHFVDQRL